MGRVIANISIRVLASVAAVSVCVQRQARTLRSHEVHGMIFRIAIPLLLLPLLAVTLPLMFALAWLHEALGDLAPARPAPDKSRETSEFVSLKKQ
jgi:hypothetical protein